MNLAIMTDSNSGITQQQAKELGVYVLPMPFMIDGEEYFEDINLTQQEFYEKLDHGCEIFTSQPSPEMVMKMWDELLEEYDQIVYLPMSSGLSSSYQTAAILAEDYDGKVWVVNNQRISVTLRQSVLDAKKLASEGMDAAQIKEKLEAEKLESSIYIMVDTLQYLKNGGRITPTVAALGTLLKIKPVLQIQGERLDSFGKARTMKQAKSMMLTAMMKDMEERFGDPQAGSIHLQIAHTQNEEAALAWKKELEAQFPHTGQIVVAPLSLSVSCHIGPGALALACSKVI